MGLNFLGFKINIAKTKKPKVITKKPVKASRLCKAIVIKEDGIFKARIALNNSEHPEYLVLNFTEDSFNLRGRDIVFTHNKDKNGHYTCFVRDVSHCKVFPGSPLEYTPFRENIVICGNVVRDNGIMYFKYQDFVAFNEHVEPTKIIKIDSSKPLFNE